jgi:cobalt/nickel transport system ATP-binding protein
METDTVLDITGLSYFYTGTTPALDSINLKVAAAEKLAVIGPNGAGKSTLLLHINGILRGKGTITVNGILLTKPNIREIRRMVGFVFQNPDDQLFSHTVYEDIAFGPSQYKHTAEEIQEKVSDALHSAGIPGFENRSPFKMSFGEQKLVSLATALVLKPKILVLDEPSSNLCATDV